MRINIYIYSQLSVYGGGRETWIDYFMGELLKNNNVEKINVFCLETSDRKNSVVDKYSNCSKICFFEKEWNIKDPNRVIQYVDFCGKISDSIIENGDICLFIGSVIEGLVSIRLNKKFKHMIQKIIWIRSIAANEIASRQTNFIAEKLKFYIASVIEKKALTISEKIIANGIDTYNYYKKKYPTESNKMKVISNAVDIHQYKYNCPFEYKKIEQLNCCYIGRLTTDKGFYDLCEIFSRIILKYPSLKRKIICNVWGTGNIARDKIPLNIILKGKALKEDLPNILKTQEVALFFGSDESNGSGGLSHSLLEAMASGKICLGYKVKYMEQIIVNNKNGILVDYKDFDQAAEEIIKIYFGVTKNKGNKYSFYKNICLNANETSQEYSVEQHVNKFLKYSQNR